MRINGETHYLWRAVDHEGEVLEVFATKRRDRGAALKFLKRTMKRYGPPWSIKTDRLRSYGAAMKVIGNIDRQECGRWLNNQAENSHQPFRRREGAMSRFRDSNTVQKFAFAHVSIQNHFNATQLDNLAGEIRRLERRLKLWHRADETSQRLEAIPGVGILTATALSASIPDPSVFKSGREFAAFLGLVPRQNSSGGKDRLGRISKMGDGYLRRLLVVGATSVVRRAGGNTSATGVWMRSLLERKPARVVTVAVANKNARIAWAILARGETYRAPMAL